MNLTYFYLSFDNSFNRYMVECESIYRVCCVGIARSFNRYMVECESNTVDNTPFIMFVLIDTWWNVNTNKLGAGVEAVEF